MESTHYILGKDGFKKAEKCPELKRGTVIIDNGVYCNETKYVVTEFPKCCILTDYDETDAEPFIILDKFCRPISEKFGIGEYYTNDLIPEEEVKAAEKHAKEIFEFQEEEKKKEAEEQAAEREELLKRYDYLIAFDGIRTRQEVKKNVALWAAREFPGIRITLRIDDDELIATVYADECDRDKFKDAFKIWIDHSFNQSYDCMDYNPSQFNRLFGGYKFVSVEFKAPCNKGNNANNSQSYDVETARKELTNELVKKYDYLERIDMTIDSAERMEISKRNLSSWAQKHFPGIDFNFSFEGNFRTAKIIVNDDGKKETDYFFSFEVFKQHYSAFNGNKKSIEQQIFNHVFGGFDYLIVEANFEKKHVKKEYLKSEESVRIVEYSEKSFAVCGDTKPIKDLLKSLGGKFNARLTCGAGWIFSARNREKVEKELNL